LKKHQGDVAEKKIEIIDKNDIEVSEAGTIIKINFLVVGDVGYGDL
jgi:hypothetical protein